MTVKEAIDYIDNFTWSTSKLGLERTQELLSLMGDPQKSLKFVHITGSNGKGSTCSMVESVLREAGYLTGLFTSPYVCDCAERIQVGGQNISDEELAEITGYVAAYADSMEDHPTQFELITAIGMEYFKRRKCDIVVLEVGMGGAMDSTNVIESPEVCAFTNIGLEHTEYLGNTLEEIAATKGGIIKPGARVVCYDGSPVVTDVLKKICYENGNEFVLADFSLLSSQPGSISLNPSSQSFKYKGVTYEIGLLGKHQIRNAAVAIEIIEALRRPLKNDMWGRRLHIISDEALHEGLKKAKWPARFEVLKNDPLFILDGGHNPQCAEALVDTLKDIAGKVIFLTGTLKDKDYHRIADIIAPFAEKLVIVTPDNPRALPAEEYVKVFTDKGIFATAEKSVAAGVEKVLDMAVEIDENTGERKTNPVVAFGSLYMAGEIRRRIIYDK